MKPINQLLAATFFICQLTVIACTVFASDEVEGDELGKLNALRTDFQLKLDKLNEPLNKLNSDYQSYLEKQKESYQQKGELKAMLEVEEELKTFASEPAEELSTHPELKRLQEIYREQRDTREKAIVEPKRKLIANCRALSEEMASLWTREGKIDVAKQALAEAERFAAMQKDAEVVGPVDRESPLGMVAENDFQGKTPGEEMRNGIGMKLCWIPEGRFTMGSPANEDGHNPRQETQVDVRITRGFWMGKYEVTQGEYQGLMGNNPSSFGKLGDEGPVDKVSWGEAAAFCQALTEREKDKLPKGWAYHLPTEAQWEYASRAGGEGAFSGGTLDEVGWFKANSENSPHEVGKKKANAWGLHDVHGNLREWCQNWMTDELAGGRDPEGPSSGNARSVRGGCWNYPAAASRVAHRSGISPDEKVYDLGFRVCLSPAGE